MTTIGHPGAAGAEVEIDNPIARARLACGLGRREFASALRVSYQEVSDHEAGRADRLRPKLRRALERAGFDAAALAAAYADWWGEKAAGYADQLQARQQALAADRR